MKHGLIVLIACYALFSCTRRETASGAMWNARVDSLLNDPGAVSNAIDSLKRQTLHAKDDTTAINLLNELAIQWTSLPYPWLADAALQKSLEKEYPQGQVSALCGKALFFIQNGETERTDSLLQAAGIIASKFRSPLSEATVLYWKGEARRRQDDYPQALNYLEKGLVLARSLDDKRRIISYLTSIGNTYYMLDQYEPAMTHYREAIALARQIGDQTLETECISCIADVYRLQSDYTTSSVQYTEALRMAIQINDKRLEGQCLENLGNIAYLRDENDKALGYFEKALSISKAQSDKNGEAYCLSCIGEVYRMQNDYAKSLHYLSESMAIAKRMHNRARIADCLSSMGEIYRMRNENDKALDYFEQSIAICRQTGDKNRTAYCLGCLGEVYSSQKNYAKALNYFKQAIAIAAELGDRIRMSDCLSSLGNMYLAQNESDNTKDPAVMSERYAQAMKHFEASMNESIAIGDKNGVADCLSRLGEIYRLTNNIPKAREYGERSLKISREIEFPEDTKTAAELLYKVYSEEKNYKGAFDMLQLFLEMRDSINDEEHVKTFVSQEYHAKNEELKLEQSKKEIIYKAEQSKKEAELNYQKNLRNAFTIGFILILALAAVILRSLQQNKKKSRIISLQKQEVEFKSKLLEQKNKEVMDSIHYAKRIQHALLASDNFLKKNLSADNRAYFVYFSPKDVVSGDFYWATSHHGKFYLVVADSTGHGVPGAFMSLLNISFLNEAINEKNLKAPNEILGHVRRRLVQSFSLYESTEGGKDGMDCALLCFDFAQNLLEFSCANNTLVLVRDQVLTELPGDRMPVGKSPKEQEPYTLHQVALQKGDTIYAFTDGYTDQFGGPKGKKFMFKRLTELLSACAPLPVEQQKERLQQHFTEWKGNLEQVDDVLVMGIRF